jgi:dolichyl-phosphate-mannose-protein mannosyltransferase
MRRASRVPDIIHLVHAPTTQNLNSHKIAAPITKLNWEVAGYGSNTIGDEHDYCVVEAADRIKDTKKYGWDDPKGHIHSPIARLRLKH